MHDDLFIAFEQWLTKQGYRPQTVKCYGRDVRAYAGDPEGSIDGVSKTRYNSLFYAYNAFADFCEHYDFELPAPRIEPPKRKAFSRRGPKHRDAKKTELPFALDEWGELKRSVWGDTSKEGAVLRVMMVSGLRIGDVLQITRKDLRAALARDDGTLQIQVKGGKHALTSVASNRIAWDALHDMLVGRDAKTVAHLVCKSGNPEAGGAGYRKMLRTWATHCKDAGVSEPHKLHRIRRTVAFELASRGVPEEDIQAVLGHDNVRTTRHYIKGFKALSVQRALQSLEGAAD